jgi:amino acid transporter
MADRLPHAGRPALARRLTLPMTVLFGLGVTIGAGIYVLIGATVGRAGMHAPLAFVLAALVMAPTAASFAEFAARYPVSAGEAAYVEVGFGLANIAEEVRDPERTLPKAIFLTLAISTVFYVLVVWIALMGWLK